jgi:arsenite-transporting ATPase
MSDVKAFNNCMSVFWRQHEAEFSRFLTSKTGDSEKAADPEKTKVIIVTLAETTPVLEAANLQRIYAELASSRGHGSLITAWQLLNRLRLS